MDKDDYTVTQDICGRTTIVPTEKGRRNSESKRNDYIKKMQSTCPEGYTVAIPGQSIDMLGATELWIIRSNHPEPHLTRVPEDLVDGEDGSRCVARVPKEWGHPLYYKVIRD